MKPQASAVINSGNIEGVTKTMTIHTEAMAHIMSVLTNLYADAIMAVIREYATNALDAHREAKNAAPIHITAPTSLKPTFTVEDFGVGMSTDTLLDLYSSYGASTKRETNEQTGMLGLGSKSALAYSPQFTIRTRHNGVETTALVFLNDKGEGEIKVMDTKACPVTANGTRIEIPVATKDVRAFTERIQKLFAFWPSDDVLIKGANLTQHVSQWTKVAEGMYLTPREIGEGTYWRGSFVLVQGGVPYTVDLDKVDVTGLPLDNNSVVLYAPIGSLQFTPARESLYYTPNTIKAIEAQAEAFHKQIAGFVEREVAVAKDRPAALAVFDKFRYLVKDGNVIRWNGEVVPASVPCVAGETDTAKRATVQRHKVLPPLAKMKELDLIVYGASASQTTQKGSYATRVNAAGHLTGNYSLVERYYGSGQRKDILIIEGDLPEGWDWYGITAVHVDTLKPAGRVKVPGVSQATLEYREREWKIAGKYGSTTKVDPQDDKVLYVYADEQYDFHRAPSDWTVIMVPKNQRERFAKAFPLAKTPSQAAAEAAKTAKITYDEAEASYVAGGFDQFAQLPTAEILDPDLVRVLGWMKNKPANVVKAEKLASDLRWLNVSVQIDSAKTPLRDSMEKRYLHIMEAARWSRMTVRDRLDLANALYTYKYQGGTK